MPVVRCITHHTFYCGVVNLIQPGIFCITGIFHIEKRFEMVASQHEFGEKSGIENMYPLRRKSVVSPFYQHFYAEIQLQPVFPEIRTGSYLVLLIDIPIQLDMSIIKIIIREFQIDCLGDQI